MSTVRQIIADHSDRLVRMPQQPRLDGLDYTHDIATLPIARAIRPGYMQDDDLHNAYQIAKALQSGHVVHLYCDDDDVRITSPAALDVEGV